MKQLNVRLNFCWENQVFTFIEVYSISFRSKHREGGRGGREEGEGGGEGGGKGGRGKGRK